MRFPHPLALHFAVLSAVRPLSHRVGSVLGLAVLLGLALWPERVDALDPARTLAQYNARTWRRMDRLPSEAITAIVQSGDGHLWLGTRRGLVDFDGVEFRSLGLPGQSEGFSRVVSSLTLRRDGGLWVGTERGGYGLFDGTRFGRLPHTNLGGEYPTTRCMLEAPDGSLWISTAGMVGRRSAEGVEEVVSTEMDVFCMQRDTRGRVWLGTAAHGLYYWENGRLVHVEGAAAQLWGNNLIHALAVSLDGVVWVGATNGVHSIDPDLTPRASIGFGGQTRALLVDRNGVLWIGGLFDGLLRFRDGALERLGRGDGIASDHVLTLAESADGSLWVGTEDGLTQISDVKFPIVSRAEGLSGDACLSVAAAPEGGIWAGTTNGLTRIVDGRCTSFGRDRTDGFSSEWIRRVFVARNGDLYLLGGKQDLSRFRAGRVEKTWALGVWSQSIAEDDAGVMLSVGDTLVRVVDDKIVPYRLPDGVEPRFGWVNKMLVARDGALWVASNSGLVQIRDGKAHDWMRGRTDTDQAFYALSEDDAGAIWAVRSSGLVRIKDGRIDTVSHRQGLYSDHVFTVVADLLGNFWMDSSEGFFRVAQRELNAVADGRLKIVECTVFDGSHVVKTSEKSNSEYSGCRSTDGRIWLPSAKGVIQIDPSHLPVNSLPPPLRLERVLFDGRAYPTDREPQIEAGVRNLEFNYVAIDYQSPERIRYRYRLEGYQTDWVEAGARRSAFFTNLPAGRYHFRVQACNADGVWNTAGAGLSFVLPTHVHDRWWFRGILAVAGVGLLALAWFARERRRRHEIAEIRHREELQLQMIESSPVPMVMLDQPQQILYVNAAFTRVFGYAAAEIPDLETWWRLAKAESVANEEWVHGWRRRIAEAAATRRSIEPVATAVAHKDGSLRHTVVTTSAVGERTLVICSDLTEQKRAEEAQRRIEEQLRQTQKMEAVGRLSGGIAHDFNNLLTVILGNVMLLERETLPQGITHLIGEIRGASSRASELTKQLLAFSRKQPFNPAPIDLNRVVREMADVLRSLVGEVIRIDLALSPGVAPVRADTTMLEQVVLNLVVNARDAMPRGGIITVSSAVVTITADAVPAVHGARAGTFVRLSVRDEGSGIPPAVLPRIFEPFFTTKDVGKGTGLGLATVFGIVEQHRGWIEVETAVGRGSTFHVCVPAETVQPFVPARLVESLVRPVAGGARVILLVEDNDGVRALASRALKGEGYEVIEAASGPEALEIWKEQRDRIEILFTDVVMPGGLDGVALAQQLLASKPALKVIYTSGYSAEVVGGDFSGREGIDFLGKPYRLADLLQIVARAAASAAK